MDLGIKDKVALVAGASSGLGFGAARVLFDEGARVALCSRDGKRITAAGRSLSDDTARVLPVACDLTRAADIERLVKAVTDAFGRIDIVVANCGGPPLGKHDSLSEEDWQLGYNLTLMSSIRLIQAVLPGMKAQRFGRIILTTSMSAKQPVDNLMLSNTYRAGLLGYAKTLSREIASDGITVNTVMPGYTRTERLEYFADEITAKTGQSRDDIYAGWVASVPMGRLGEPNELGSFIAYLASTQAAYITGTATAVDGGRIAGI